MFSVLQSPYNIEPITSVFCEPMFLAPEPKRRRCHHGPMGHQPCNIPEQQHESVPIRYEVEEADRGYILSLYRPLKKDALKNELNRQLFSLKEQLYKPTYHYCKFLGGLVEEQPDEEALLRQAMSQLDVDGICRRLARNTFKDYKIELNYRGDELAIVSRLDGVAKEFDLGTHIDDLEILGCRLDKSYTNAVWKILLVKPKERAIGVTRDLLEQTEEKVSQAGARSEVRPEREDLGMQHESTEALSSQEDIEFNTRQQQEELRKHPEEQGHSETEEPEEPQDADVSPIKSQASIEPKDDEVTQQSEEKQIEQNHSKMDFESAESECKEEPEEQHKGQSMEFEPRQSESKDRELEQPEEKVERDKPEMEVDSTGSKPEEHQLTQDEHIKEDDSQMEVEPEEPTTEVGSKGIQQATEENIPQNGPETEDVAVQEIAKITSDSRSAYSKIEINFHDSQSSKKLDIRRRNSPIMEEVEDAEASRFRQLVRRAPTGSAILEDY
ncbi:BTN2 (YGR142W) and CUR1 (YPR158W) [Zygosaccharomyces parabailii]|uniref:ZYBA0S03-04302g1_1 n=1 Tax=Zygosaccharomyces bailii (strain CLIB 213 / ATCC 58445 / CBS 680 / BCRC 21525 / NBRC 1098 / NCYC 1416 / NRRL Y-2227) TaxID=1333698 RepID=A0A8J2T5U9_ZYGB2|nr:BTN2 (YGR142W) and CUR1 (YPR158W) [Zygosaccharomyces parabailii]CDF88890.1 ZYBA0S03-04302g1_1 [Zygosaccharomyces bailii CLIB 213]CDH15976.1 uncharacterized protein ZBAI_07764 [Zygosaccharomyces bailii ISA1307]